MGIGVERHPGAVDRHLIAALKARLKKARRRKLKASMQKMLNSESSHLLIMRLHCAHMGNGGTAYSTAQRAVNSESMDTTLALGCWTPLHIL